MDRNMKYQDMQEYAKTLGINAFGMKKPELIAAIEATEGGTETTEAPPVTPAPVYEKPDYTEAKEETPAPAPVPAPQVDPAAVYAVLSKEINDKFAQMQNALPAKKKESPPDSVIANSHKSDKMAIASMEKVPITIPGGYVGAPKYHTSTVNGHRIQVKTGETVMVPLAHFENIKAKWKEKQKNMDRFAAMEREAKQL